MRHFRLLLFYDPILHIQNKQTSTGSQLATEADYRLQAKSDLKYIRERERDVEIGDFFHSGFETSLTPCSLSPRGERLNPHPSFIQRPSRRLFPSQFAVVHNSRDKARGIFPRPITHSTLIAMLKRQTIYFSPGFQFSFVG